MPKCLLTLLLGLVLVLNSCTDKPATTLRLGVTTTLEDSGLLRVLTTAFSKQYGINITPIVTGSGQLFRLIERGDVDIAISHEPKGEKTLLEKGIIQSRKTIFYNYFVLVGDQTDPAAIRQATSIEDAFHRLAASADSTFVSRHDNSGTHKMEQRLWAAVPFSHHAIKRINTGTGMGATLAVAANRRAYTLVDLGTWLNYQNKQQLVIVWDNPQRLRNPYQLLTIDNETLKPANREGAQRFATWISSPETRALIRDYQLHQQTVFFTEN
jgi:tungstate transport system substrate-binding protein